jgi:5'-nucleotidase
MFLKLNNELPTIVVTNDDGIDSGGISALTHRLSPLGNIVVVAPEGQRSAISHAITLKKAIRFHPYSSANGYHAYVTDGTPADCIKFAVRHLLEKPPQLVVSGINLGPNTGTNILYSGTVAAAVEAYILGINGLAVSLDTYTDPIYETAAAIAAGVAQKLVQGKIPEKAILNLNIPNIPLREVKGLRVTHMGHTNFNDFFEEDHNGKRHHFWLKDDSNWEGNTEQSDVVAVKDGYASLTPLKFDFTDHKLVAQLVGTDFGGFD